jgi:hypothetical protein
MHLFLTGMRIRDAILHVKEILGEDAMMCDITEKKGFLKER